MADKLPSGVGGTKDTTPATLKAESDRATETSAAFPTLGGYMIKLNFAGSFALIFAYWIKLDAEVIYSGIIAAAALASVVCYLRDANKRIPVYVPVGSW